MIIYPAIDIKDGSCVRLSQGRFDQVTVYETDPAKQAVVWQQQGGEFIHVVDLDGAREGLSKNSSAIERIVNAVSVPVELGGGIRNRKSLEWAFSIGLSRVILGTAAVEDLEFLRYAVGTYGDKIAVGIDAKDGIVKTSGWEKSGGVEAVPFAKEMDREGVKTIIYTDIATDGMLNGPNLAAMDEMNRAVKADIVASGGVSCKQDIRDLYKIHVSGVITGKALYDGRLTLPDALAAARGD